MVFPQTIIVQLFLLAISVHFNRGLGGEAIQSTLPADSPGSRHSCFPNSDSTVCKGPQKSKKYFLYDVNDGEGFNLRRDVYIRIAPLISSLNKLDARNQWILVLPPWGRIPHWKNQFQYFQWSTFFRVDQVQNFIPAIELHQFLDEYGYDSKISEVFQLQHFPFDPKDPTWTEKIETGVPCEEALAYKWNKDSGGFTGRFWDERLTATKASCMSLRGQASTLLNFLLEANYSSVMFDRAEVILWDDYGGWDWWEARRSLRFSTHLSQVASDYLNLVLNQSEDGGGGGEKSGIPAAGLTNTFKYVGVHLRRRDFIFGRRKLSLPSVQGAAKQAFQIAKRLKLYGVFLATDGPADEFEDFALAFQILKLDHGSGISLLSLHPEAPVPGTFLPSLSSFSEGQLAILDQILCTTASYFIGTPDSTFTLRIFEEREILGFDSDSTFNYLCPDLSEEEDVFTEVTDCKQPTKWKMKN